MRNAWVEVEAIARHLLHSILLAIRYGLIALLVTLAAGKGCKTWPLIKQKSGVEVRR